MNEDNIGASILPAFIFSVILCAIIIFTLSINLHISSCKIKYLQHRLVQAGEAEFLLKENNDVEFKLKEENGR